jgi:hypothetical protein
MNTIELYHVDTFEAALNAGRAGPRPSKVTTGASCAHGDAGPPPARLRPLGVELPCYANTKIRSYDGS